MSNFILQFSPLKKKKLPALNYTHTHTHTHFLCVIWPQVTFPNFNVKTEDKAHERLVCLPTMREDFYYERENTALLPVLICLNLASSPTTQQGCLSPLFSSTAFFQKKIHRWENHVLFRKTIFNQERLRYTEWHLPFWNVQACLGFAHTFLWGGLQKCEGHLKEKNQWKLKMRLYYSTS